MVESSEQQIAGALVDGSLAHKTAAPVAAARADRAAPSAPSQGGDRGANERWRCRNLENGYPTQTCGENELQDLEDVHWKALTLLAKLHKRHRRMRKRPPTGQWACRTKPRAVPRGCCTRGGIKMDSHVRKPEKRANSNLTWPAQIQIQTLLPGSQDTDSRATRQTHAIHRACVGADAQGSSGSMDDFSDSGPMTGRAKADQRKWQLGSTWCWKKGRTTNQHGQGHSATGHDKVL